MAYRSDNSRCLILFKSGKNRRGHWAHHHAMQHRQKWMKMHQGQPGMNFESEQQQSESVDGFLRAEKCLGSCPSRGA